MAVPKPSDFSPSAAPKPSDFSAPKAEKTEYFDADEFLKSHPQSPNSLPNAVTTPQDLPNASPVQTPNSAVKEMQQAIVDFAKDFSSHSMHFAPDRQSENGETLRGADPFSNFLVHNFVNTAPTTGNQVVNAPVNMPTRMDTSKENDNLKGILMTLTRIGNPALGETQPDGVWGSRTNNALSQVAALASMMIQLKNSLGVSFQTDYSEKDLDKLKSSIPTSPASIPVGKEGEVATSITNQITALRSFYDMFRDYILDNPGFKDHITQQKPFLIEKGYKGLNRAPDPEKYKYLQNVAVNSYVDGHPIAIMPVDLLNMENFALFAKNHVGEFSLTPEQHEAVVNGDTNTLGVLLNKIVRGLDNTQEQR